MTCVESHPVHKLPANLHTSPKCSYIYSAYMMWTFDVLISVLLLRLLEDVMRHTTAPCKIGTTDCSTVIKLCTSSYALKNDWAGLALQTFTKLKSVSDTIFNSNHLVCPSVRVSVNNIALKPFHRSTLFSMGGFPWNQG